MVLVSKKPSNGIGILQTKLSDRERHETRRGGLEAMPLNKHIEGRHGEGQARLKIGPAPVHDLFEMTNERQHREHCLYPHTVLPLPPLTPFEVGGIAFHGMEGGSTQDNHALFNLPNPPLKGIVGAIGRGTGRIPIFPIRLPAEHGVKWPSVSTSATDPLCSRAATGVWPRHWRDTKRDRALSTED